MLISLSATLRENGICICMHFQKMCTKYKLLKTNVYIRVTTRLENLEMSESLTAVREMTRNWPERGGTIFLPSFKISWPSIRQLWRILCVSVMNHNDFCPFRLKTAWPAMVVVRTYVSYQIATFRFWVQAGVGRMDRRSAIYTGWPKNWHNVLYALTLPNINRFSKFFHCQNQEKICNNTITRDSTTPQLCRYTTVCPTKAPRRGVLPSRPAFFLKHFTYLYIWCKNCRMWQLL